MNINLALEFYRHYIPVEIRFADLDSMGHVNNAIYLTYIEVGRIRYFRDLNLFEDRFKTSVGPIIARSVIDYHQPITLDDNPITVYTRTVRLGSKSCDMEHVVVRTHGGEPQVAAVGKIVLVAYDYKANSSVPLPDSWRTQIAAYEPTMNKTT
jgi:acyl-CoA thioester hydrolase